MANEQTSKTCERCSYEPASVPCHSAHDKVRVWELCPSCAIIMIGNWGCTLVPTTPAK